MKTWVPVTGERRFVALALLGALLLTCVVGCNDTPREAAAPKDPGQRMLDAIAARQAKARELLARGKAALNANNPPEAAALFRKALVLAPDLTEASQQLEFAQGLLGEAEEPPDHHHPIRRLQTDLEIDKQLGESNELLSRARKLADFQASANAAQVAMDMLATNKVLYTPTSYRDWRAMIEQHLKFVATRQKEWERLRQRRRRHSP